MSSLSLYFSTLRHLRPIQISSRLRLLSRRKVLLRTENSREARYAPPADAPFQRLDIHAPTYAPMGEHIFETNTFVFLNDTQTLGDPINWLPPEATQLWKYNLHYFDFTVLLANNYLTADDQGAYHTFQRLATSWMDSCPMTAPLAWDPYPISLRTSNWLKAYSWFAAEIDLNATFATRLRQSIWAQVRCLEDNLEYHLLGNHLIENGRALLLAGLFFQDDAGARWRNKGMQILVDEFDEQILTDGGHYERSPMYHQIMLHLYTDVIDTLTRQGIAAPRAMVDGVEDMQRWLQVMRHPDGEISLFNDAALQIAPAVDHQSAHATTAEDGFHALPASGYFAFKDAAAGNALIFDCGPLGPDYQPGHGHSDTLSYELSLDGQRMIVDSGVANYYGDGEWRHYYRSTRAHNTLVVDDAEQSEVWGRFRVAHRAYPQDVDYRAEKDGVAYVVGSHTGYQRLPGKPKHRRWIAWIDRRFWVVWDQIDGDGEHKLESLIHLHPEANIRWSPADDDSMRGVVERGSSTMQILPWGATGTAHVHGQVEPIQGWYAPEFGIAHPNHVWSLHHEGPLPHSMGYVLWPGKEAVEVSVNDDAATDVTVEEDQCHQLIVRAENMAYRITCTYHEVKMEKLQ